MKGNWMLIISRIFKNRPRGNLCYSSRNECKQNSAIMVAAQQDCSGAILSSVWRTSVDFYCIKSPAQDFLLGGEPGSLLLWWRWCAVVFRLLQTQILTDIAVHGTWYIKVDVTGVEFCTLILVKIVPLMAAYRPNNGSFFAILWCYASCLEAFIG